MFGPAYSAVLPGLVGKEDLPGAISLNSAQMNASRVIGPVIGGLLYSLVGPAWIFAGNAATYLFVVGGAHDGDAARRCGRRRRAPAAGAS